MERGPDDGGRLLVVTADDFGLTAATSDAIVAAHHEGIVTATSVLVVAPAAVASLRRLADAPDLEVGLHAALVGEDPPVLPAAEIPSLVDRRGRLAPSWRALLPRLAAGRVDPDEVVAEVEAQLAVLRSGPTPVTHLDLHQHVHLWPTVGEAITALARRHGIGYVRTPSSNRSGPRGAAVRRLSSGLRRRVAARGLGTSDGFLGLDEAGAWDRTRLAGAIAASTAASVEVNLHPGAHRDADRDRYRWDYGWGVELEATRDEGVRRAVADAGLRLVGPSAVAARARA